MRARILEDRAEDVDRIEILEGIADDDGPAERLGAGADEGDRLRMAFRVDEEGLRLGLRDALGHRHGLGRSRRLVEQRCVGDVEAGQVGDHRLVVQQRFEAALADFRLVGRIGRVPGRIFQNVALDHRRRDRAVVALADERDQHLVLVGGLAQPVERFALGHGRAPGQRHLLPYGRRQRRIDQPVEAAEADDLQHVGHFGRRRTDVPAVGEVVGLVVRERKFGGRIHYTVSSL